MLEDYLDGDDAFKLKHGDSDTLLELYMKYGESSSKSVEEKIEALQNFLSKAKRRFEKLKNDFPVNIAEDKKIRNIDTGHYETIADAYFSIALDVMEESDDYFSGNVNCDLLKDGLKEFKWCTDNLTTDIVLLRLSFNCFIDYYTYPIPDKYKACDKYESCVEQKERMQAQIEKWKTVVPSLEKNIESFYLDVLLFLEGHFFNYYDARLSEQSRIVE